MKENQIFINLKQLHFCLRKHEISFEATLKASQISVTNINQNIKFCSQLNFAKQLPLNLQMLLFSKNVL